jgi:hypothetical protein
MYAFASFRTFALSLPDTEELPHFEKTSFRRKGKIFATVNEGTHVATLKLSLVWQSVYVAAAPHVFSPVLGSWGAKGFTHALLQHAPPDMIEEALLNAWEEVGRKKK